MAAIPWRGVLVVYALRGRILRGSSSAFVVVLYSYTKQLSFHSVSLLPEVQICNNELLE